MPASRTAVEIARLLADVLEQRPLPYAIGGALALAFYAPPRATIDVDVNIFVSPTRALDTALAALSDAGFVPDKDAHALAAQARTEGQFRGHIDDMRIDVFVPAIPFYARLQEHRRQVPLLGRPLWILGAADLVVLKLMFNRRKDLADVEAVMVEQGPQLDRAYVRQTLAELVGPDDERLAALDAIERDIDQRQG